MISKDSFVKIMNSLRDYNDKADQYKDRIDPWQEACTYAKFMTNEV